MRSSSEVSWTGGRSSQARDYGVYAECGSTEGPYGLPQDAIRSLLFVVVIHIDQEERRTAVVDTHCFACHGG